MARYIDADKLVAWCKDTYQAQSTTEGKAYVNAFLTQVFSAPTADVVPRAELAVKSFQDAATIYHLQESLKKTKTEVVKALNEVELLIIITKETYKQQMEDAPNELSKQSKRTKWIAFEKFYEQFAELKKKYIEN